MKEKYRFIEKQLFEKAVLLIEETIKAAKSPLPENVIASLVVEAWNISYFPEEARETEIKDIKKWYKQQGYLSQKQTEEILRKVINRKWEVTNGIEWKGLWTRIVDFKLKKLKDGKRSFEFELEFWE